MAPYLCKNERKSLFQTKQEVINPLKLRLPFGSYILYNTGIGPQEKAREKGLKVVGDRI